MDADTNHAVVEESQEPAPPEYEPGTEPTPPEYDLGTERLPGYFRELSGLERILQARRHSNAATLSRDDATWDIESWRQYLEIYPPPTKPWDERDAQENFFAESSLFFGIDFGKEEVISFLIENGIVTPNTKRDGETPLLRAVTKKNVQMVKYLLDLGADKDALGSASQYYSSDEGTVHVIRTPLQHAASSGHIVLVKLLMETYHCDDAIVAPDGQTALRLAADNGHQKVVDYLPSRRLGGFRRWKHTHRKSLRRAKKAVSRIFEFLKFFCCQSQSVARGAGKIEEILAHGASREYSSCQERLPDLGKGMDKQVFDMVVETGVGENTKSPWNCSTMDFEWHYVFRKGSLECHPEDNLAPVNSGGGSHLFSSESYAG
ncbi:hypothetical protein V490_08705 [Pseudogymnoascus sp. VKM F-3557]|nr:hypothetical protein V490_08705 [Pseudogymnoascus sp. VKM F-3557]